MEFTTATYITITGNEFPSPLVVTKDNAIYFTVLNGTPCIWEDNRYQPVLTNDFNKLMQFLEDRGMRIH